MKKSSLLFSSIAAGLLLTIISCSKEVPAGNNPYRNEITPAFADTPYLGINNQALDTPYLPITPGVETVADTPYLHNH